MSDIFIAIIVVVVIIGGLVVFVNEFNENQIEKSCKVFGEESRRETKFVKYTYWHRDCLMPQENGWISAFNLRGN